MPFKDVVGHIDQGIGGPAELSVEPIKRPVLEIITSVCIGGRPVDRERPRHNRGRAYVQQDRPITAALDNVEYRSDYCSDEEQPYTVTTGIPRADPPYMLIHSEHLINAIRATVKYYPGVHLGGNTISINSPYRMLYHHRRELVEYRDNQPAVHDAKYALTTVDHINILLQFLEENIGCEVRQEEERHKLETPMATFGYFWLLLKPGELVYAKRHDIWAPFVVSSVRAGYEVNCWHLESNGTKIGRFMERFGVSPWLGEQAIDSLSVIPAAYWVEDLEAQGGRTMREKQIEQGKLYWELLQRPTYMAYDGLLVNSASGNRQSGGPTGFMCGRVICDAAGFDKYYESSPEYDIGSRRRGYSRRRGGPTHTGAAKDHLPRNLPRCGCESCSKNRQVGEDGPFLNFEDLDPLHDEPPQNDIFYMVLSSIIPGFILGTRRWGNLHLANLQPVQPDKEAFKYLVLNDDIKLTVKALIGKFAAGIDGQITPWGNDFIKNKGEGRIFLLHGTPGVGKTCTAECIAELSNRPLISLTSGDLSVEPYRVEDNLSYFLELGQRYGALVLLDEADVYLERRHSSDLERNGLVSVFLRALEYYRGVLFLTTNRVQSFDVAFLSRIHVALHYKNLKDEDRERIWTHNFDRLNLDSQGKIRVSVAAREYIWTNKQVQSLKWNGREIRNAMQTALALAESEAQDENLETVTVSEKHLRAVVKMSKGFRNYVKRSALMGNDYDGGEEDSDDESDD